MFYIPVDEIQSRQAAVARPDAPRAGRRRREGRRGDAVTAMLHTAVGHVLALNPLDSTSLLTSLGVLGVFLVIFAETGLLIGSSCSPPPRARCSARRPATGSGSTAGGQCWRAAAASTSRPGPPAPRNCSPATGTAKPSCWPASSRSCAPSSTPWQAPWTSLPPCSPAGR